MNITTLGVDLAKTSFSLVGMDKHGKIVLRKTLTRSRLLSSLSNHTAKAARMIIPMPKPFARRYVVPICTLYRLRQWINKPNCVCTEYGNLWSGIARDC
jgi:hypothetical protein